MKFDMSRAWNDAVATLSGNRDVVLVVAAVFFFLPYFATSLMLSGPAGELDSLLMQNEDNPEIVMRAVLDFFGSYGWVFTLLTLAQALGIISLLALLTDHARPTVGEALKTGAVGLLPYIGVQILQGLAIVAVLGLPTAIGAATGISALAALLALAGMVGVFYLLVKFSLTLPCIAIEKMMNPLKVLARSWQLTKGNSLRLFGFYALLFVALIVLSLVVGMVASVLTMLPGTLGLILGGFVSALLQMVSVMVIMAVLAAIHRQLSGGSGPAIQQTFE